jgi:hypothetical protein
MQLGSGKETDAAPALNMIQMWLHLLNGNRCGSGSTKNTDAAPAPVERSQMRLWL